MIVKMQKMYAAVRGCEKDRLLTTLRDMGVVHLQPVDVETAHPDEVTASQVQRLARAEQILSGVHRSGDVPDLEPTEAADRVLELFGRASELNTRLASMTREVDQLALWGDLKLDRLAELQAAGLTVCFYAVSPKDLGDVPGDCVHVVTHTGRHAVVAAVFGESSVPEELPETVEPLQLPEHDRPTLRAEAKKVRDQQKADAAEMTQLAHLLEAISAEHAACAEDARYMVADRGGVDTDALFALQGWVPRNIVATMPAKLSEADLDVGVDFTDPAEDEAPPTLVKYPRWARPMEGLFGILGTTPGYREFDVSGSFMLALPVFAAMLIADGGYGLLFMVPALLMYKKLCRAAGKPLAQLIIIIGGVSVVWGIVTCSFFGVGYNQLKEAGGFWGAFVGWLDPVLLYRGSPEQEGPRLLITRLVFIMGAVHMTVAHLWRGLAVWPSVKALSNVGWAIFLWGMLLVVNMLVVGDPMHPATGWLLGIGGGMAIVFGHPSKNIAKMLGLGIADFPLTAVGALSDTISYIRLMAVGLASAILASSFNSMAADVAASATWFAGAVVLLLGHGLNIGLAIIALFAHGVRLNMLEFSNSLGMEWSGHTYEPFATRQV